MPVSTGPAIRAVCNVDGCERNAVAKGLCGSHYNRNKRFGSPEGLSPRHGHRMGQGRKESPTYCSWRAMKSRCNNPSDAMYYRYGGRGIAICERWDRSFAEFQKDMGDRPEGTTIERIDPNRGYEPGNCEWVSRAKQNSNKANSRMLTIYGKTMCLAKWHKIVAHEISYKAIHKRLAKGWSHKEAVFGRAA